MSQDEIAKNLLLNKTCDNCNTQKSISDKQCVRYLGEACGWQWWEMAEENTCEDWKK